MHIVSSPTVVESMHMTQQTSKRRGLILWIYFFLEINKHQLFKIGEDTVAPQMFFWRKKRTLWLWNCNCTAIHRTWRKKTQCLQKIFGKRAVFCNFVFAKYPRNREKTCCSSTQMPVSCWWCWSSWRTFCTYIYICYIYIYIIYYIIYILYIYHFHKGHGIEWRFKTEWINRHQPVISLCHDAMIMDI